MEDEEIIELFFCRDERAISELDIKYGALCRSLSMNVLNDREDAEECVNDAYLGAWNSIPPRRPNPLAAYICGIVRNISLKCRRGKNAAKRGGGYDAALSELSPYLPAPDTAQENVERKELTGLIESFLDTLGKENRVIFLRRYWFGDSYESIAESTGLSVKNVSVRLTRTREKLKQYLGERGYYHDG